MPNFGMHDKTYTKIKQLRTVDLNMKFFMAHGSVEHWLSMKKLISLDAELTGVMK